MKSLCSSSKRCTKSCSDTSEDSAGSENGDLTYANVNVEHKIKKRGRPIGNNAARERTRVQSLRSAFLDLQRTLPSVPPDTKLSKLDVLVLATTYISHLIKSLDDGCDVPFDITQQNFHPVKKWPMRSRLYAGLAQKYPNSVSGGGIHHSSAVELVQNH